jgi:hypothetical protein
MAKPIIILLMTMCAGIAALNASSADAQMRESQPALYTTPCRQHTVCFRSRDKNKNRPCVRRTTCEPGRPFPIYL